MEPVVDRLAGCQTSTAKFQEIEVASECPHFQQSHCVSHVLQSTFKILFFCYIFSLRFPSECVEILCVEDGLYSSQLSKSFQYEFKRKLCFQATFTFFFLFFLKQQFSIHICLDNYIFCIEVLRQTVGSLSVSQSYA